MGARKRDRQVGLVVRAAPWAHSAPAPQANVLIEVLGRDLHAEEMIKLDLHVGPGSKTALTQLVGRILRQPYARKTGDRWLDESYVFCFRRRGAELLQEVRRGFGREGPGRPASERGRRRRRPVAAGPARGAAPGRALPAGGARPGAAGVHDPRPGRVAARALRSGPAGAGAVG